MAPRHRRKKSTRRARFVRRDSVAAQHGDAAADALRFQPVGGTLISNASWITAKLTDLLASVSVRGTARLIKVEGADDYDEVIPIEDAPNILVAYAMGGRELASAHGYPVRLIFPGRYGMRSVKWVTRLRLLTMTGESYWGRRGWNDEALMLTGSRIDTPRNRDEVSGDLVVAGIAWAGTRTVSAVEVSVDDGQTWLAAQLEAAINQLSWRRWRLNVTLPAGAWTIAARAIDGEGNVQDAEDRFPILPERPATTGSTSRCVHDAPLPRGHPSTAC